MLKDRPECFHENYFKGSNMSKKKQTKTKHFPQQQNFFGIRVLY